MAKKKKKIDKIVIPKEKIYQAQKERFNPYQTGTGAHKSPRDYTRKRKHKNRGWE